PRETSCIVEEVIGVKMLIAKIIKHTAMEMVCARFGNRVDNGAKSLTILRRIALFEYLNFLNAVHAHTIDARFDTAKNIRRSVQVNSTRVDAVNKNARAAKGRRYSVDTCLKLIRCLNRSRYSGEQLCKVTAINRVVLNTLRSNRIANRWCLGINTR